MIVAVVVIGICAGGPKANEAVVTLLLGNLHQHRLIGAYGVNFQKI